jgi:hypothetical protein
LWLTNLVFRDVSSDRWAWLQTKGAPGFRDDPHPSEETTWGTIGTANAISRGHFDDAGFFTTTQVLEGKKYWVAFRRDPSLPDGDLRGDLASTKWAPPFNDFYNHKFKGYFVAEAIEMTAGVLLYVFSMHSHVLYHVHHFFSGGNSPTPSTSSSPWPT